MLPNFIGLGGNRSGSTWYADNLMRHGDIFVPRIKEIHFFDADYDKGMDFYESFFTGWSGEKAVGEVTPAYFYSATIARRIKKDLPGIKLFVSLRNPVDRAYSQYWRMIGMGYLEKDVSFEEALETRGMLLSYGMHSVNLSNYYEYFDRDDLLPLLFDSIKKEPETVLNELFAFLGVEPEAEANYTLEAINRSASLPNLGRSKGLYYLRRMMNRLGIHSLRDKMENINRTVLPPMNPETRQYLTDYFREDILKTEELIGKDLSGWLKPATR